MTDGQTLREVMGNFATGVTVVTLASADNHGLTANAISSVSLEPPLILVSIDNQTNSHDLLSNGLADGFCVNILAADQLHLGEYFADMGDQQMNPFAVEPTTTAATGAAIFTDSLAFADCNVWKSVLAGDHTVYIGEVRDANVLDHEKDALTFFRGEWGSVATGAGGS